MTDERTEIKSYEELVTAFREWEGDLEELKSICNRHNELRDKGLFSDEQLEYLGWLSLQRLCEIDLSGDQGESDDVDPTT